VRAWITIILLSVLAASSIAQDTVKVSLVYLEHSETLSFDEKRLPDAQILRGNVCFRHDSMLMYCDSAYFFEKENSLHAFGHVHMIQGDTLEGFGDKLLYNGNSKLARLRQNVKLIHKSTTLTTDNLDYNRQQGIAYYFSGGMIVDSLNTLTSRWGQYTPDNHQAIFRDNVKLVNPKFILTADTLGYNTENYQSDLVGPTKILYEEETTILSTNGWYNTKTELSQLLDRSQIIHADGMALVADTIYYDKANGYGRCLGNIESTDSTNQMTLYGHISELWEDGGKAYVTDSAMLLDWSDSTAFTYMHADTLWTEEIPYQTYSLSPRDSIMVDSVMVAQQPDTIWIDTTYQQIRAFQHVRIFREDIQAVCDTAHYHGRDSILTLLGLPICWNETNQMSADQMNIYIKNQTVDYMHGIGNALAIKQEGFDEYNQMTGKEMLAYVKDGDIYLVDVQGNAETIFYPREDDGTYIGVNRTQSSFVKVYLHNRTIDRVLFTTATTGVMIPLDQALPEETKLNGFFWAADERPLKPKDIFLQPQRTVRPEAVAISASADDEEEEEIPMKGKAKNKQR
jgi:lipopolysaccharide export system protein LptA